MPEENKEFEKFWTTAVLFSVNFPKNLYEQFKIACKLSFLAGQQAERERKEGECVWQENNESDWETSCDDIFCLEDGMPSENTYNFCPKCGKHLIEKEYVPMPICYECGKESPANEMNGIDTKSGTKYFCKEKECQQAFFDEAGDPPDQE